MIINTKHIKQIVLFIFLIQCYSGFSQDYNIDSLLSKGFIGGQLEFRKHIIQHLNYPEKDFNEGVYGISISEIKLINNCSDIEVNIINSLSNDIDNIIIKTVKKTQKLWVPIDEFKDTIIFYLPVAFQNDILYERLELNTKMIIDLVVITKMFPKKKNMLSAQELSKLIIAAIKSEKYDIAINHIDYYLKIDPFNIKIRELKISCLNKLGKKSQIIEEIGILNNYIDNKSLKELLM